MLIAFVWISAIGILTPTYLEINGTFGYNCHFGKCDFIPLSDENYSIFISIVTQCIIPYMIPLIITMLSYGYVWYYIWKNRGLSRNKELKYEKYTVVNGNIDF